MRICTLNMKMSTFYQLCFNKNSRQIKTNGQNDVKPKGNRDQFALAIALGFGRL